MPAALAHFNPEVLLDNATSAIKKGASVLVYKADGTTVASIYSSPSGATKANPFLTDATSGNFDFYGTDPGYTLKVDGTFITGPPYGTGTKLVFHGIPVDQLWIPVGLVGSGVAGASGGNTAAINASMAACSAAGGGVCFLPRPDVSYYLTYDTLLASTATYAALIVPSNVTLTCAPGTKITAPPAGTGPSAAGAYRLIVSIGDNVTPAVNAAVIGLDIDGQQTALSALEDQMGVAVCGGTNIRIEKNNIHNIRGDLVKTGEVALDLPSQDVWVVDNNMHDGTGQAVGCSGPVGTGAARDWIIARNICRTSLSNWGGVGPGAAEVFILTDTCSGFRVVDNILEGWGCIHLDHCTDMEVRGNKITPADGGKGGVLLAGNNINVRVVGNDIDVTGSHGHGVSLENANNAACKVDGNTIKRSSLTTLAGVCGILSAATAAPTDLSIQGNTIYNGNATDGSPDIMIFGGGAWVTIANNDCGSNTTAIFTTADVTMVNGNACHLGGIILTSAANCVVGGNFVTALAPVYAYGGSGVALGLLDSPDAVVSGNALSGSVLSVSVGGSGSTGVAVTGNRIGLGSSGVHINEAGGNSNTFVPNKFIGTPVVTLTGAASVGVQSVTGSRGGNVALASSLAALAKAQLIADNST